MGRRLVVELYFPDGVNEEEVQREVTCGIGRTGHVVGDMFWDDDEYNDEEDEVDE